MNTPLLPTCRKCSLPLPVDAPKGLCPRCLAAMYSATETVLTETDALAAQPPLSPAELAPHFPQLEILECMGRGGMGVVYKARQKSLNRLVALKLLAPERADDPQFTARFEKEAQALAALNHPHIVGVHDFGRAGGFYFLLMEFVDGVNLRQLLRARRLTPKEALSIVPPVCDALQCAHDHGIVHRDIKPENLLMDKAGKVKIADFGIAKMLGSSPKDSGKPETISVGVGGLPDSEGRTSVTHHTAAGTPDYSAPEQASGTADHRADIYSLGVVLYEMLTGERPKHDFDPPSKRVQVDVRVDEIVLRALETRPELRFSTAAEFRTQVETVTVPAPAAPVSREVWQPPEFGWGWLVGKMFGLTFTSRLAFLFANVSALGFLAFLGFLPLAGWKVCFGFAGFFGLLGVAYLVEMIARGTWRPSARQTVFGVSSAGTAAFLILAIHFLRSQGSQQQANETVAAERATLGSRTFALRHGLGSDMAEELRRWIVVDRLGYSVVPSADNQSLTVTAAPEVLNRAKTFISVTDWPGRLKTPAGGAYLTASVMEAARSFFHACAVEASTEVLSDLLSLHVLAELKGGARGRELEDYMMGGTPDPAWEKELRGDWAGKPEALRRFVREWNRHPLSSIRPRDGVAIGFGVKHFCSVSFEGAPEEFYDITIEPKRGRSDGRNETFYFSSLPPWWEKAPPAVEVPVSRKLDAIVSGRLLDAEGKPMPGKILRFVRAGSHPKFAEAPEGFLTDGGTDAKGEFNGFELPADAPWQVMLHEDGKITAISPAVHLGNILTDQIKGVGPHAILELRRQNDRIEARVTLPGAAAPERAAELRTRIRDAAVTQ